MSHLGKDLAVAMSSAREKAGVTQVEVAKRMKTTQPAIAKWESGRATPNAKTLQRFAAAIGHQLIIEFRPAETGQK